MIIGDVGDVVGVVDLVEIVLDGFLVGVGGLVVVVLVVIYFFGWCWEGVYGFVVEYECEVVDLFMYVGECLVV